jgi:hypothetical protein
MRELIAAAELAVVMMFVTAGATKLIHLAQFREGVAGYELLPTWLLPAAAPVIAGVEIAFGVLAVPTSTRLIGTLGLIGLTAGFTTAVLIALKRGRTNIPCACFGTSSRTLDRGLVLRNGLIGICLGTSLIFSQSVALVDTPVVACGVLLAALGFSAWEFRALLTTRPANGAN